MSTAPCPLFTCHQKHLPHEEDGELSFHRGLEERNAGLTNSALQNVLEHQQQEDGREARHSVTLAFTFYNLSPKSCLF